LNHDFHRQLREKACNESAGAGATALCAVGNVAGTRRPTGATLQDDFEAYGRSQLWAATAANFTSIVLDAALLRRARFLLCNRRHAQQF
jgi:hypothetical protein